MGGALLQPARPGSSTLALAALESAMPDMLPSD